MITQTLIRELINANAANDTKLIDSYSSNLTKNFSEIVKEKTLYSLPISILSTIFEKVDFNLDNDPKTTIVTFFQFVSKSHPKESLSFLPRGYPE